MGSVIAIPLTLVALCIALPPHIVNWYKWITSYLYVHIYKRTNKRRFDLYYPEAVNDPEKVGFLAPREEYESELPHSETQLKDAADEIFCYGVNSQSERLVVRVVRGTNNKADAWVLLQLSNGNIYEILQTSGHQQNADVQSSSFTCGGLRIQCLCPMRRWRIFFSGWLRENDGNEVFVKFAFIWRSSSEIYDVISDINKHCLISALATAEWKFPSFLPPLQKLHSSLDFYAQTGIMNGTVTVGDVADYKMYLFGERLRFACSTSDINRTEFVHLLGSMPKNGTRLHLGQVTIKNVVENLVIGFHALPTGELRSIEDAKSLFKYMSSSKAIEDIDLTFSAGTCFDIKGKMIGNPKQFKNCIGWNGLLTFHNIDLQMDDQVGGGVMIYGNVSGRSKETIPKSSPVHLTNSIPLVVNFSNELSHRGEITGGKGSSLGKLTELSKSCLFTVPNGIVITTSAYKEFLSPEISEEIKDLESVVYSGSSSEKIKATCEKLSKAMVRCTLPDKLCQCIEKHLLDMCEENINSHRFAVRSSATGEDTEQMSAAGQMETFLGVQGLKEIFTAVKKCWASQFGFIAIEYKRQNGQMLNSPMAVVIQEMVPCEVAGVLFTCDPVTGNQTTLSITANYGLGESVVSGAEEPDMITLRRTAEGHLSVESIVLGAKNHKIVMKDDGEVHSEDIPESMSSVCCLSAEKALKLGSLGIKIEKYYKSCRDIEWGILNGKFYILQSRPVTSGTNETDHELMHELDGPLRCENDYFTVCNVGEVMPGSTSPLGIDILLKYFSFVFQRRSANNPDVKSSFLGNNYYPVGLIPFYNHVMLTVIELIFRLDKSTSTMTQGTMIGLFGRILDDEEMYKVARNRFKNSQRVNKINMRSAIRILRELFFAGTGIDSMKKKIESYRIPVEDYKSSKEVYYAITHNCTDIYEPFVKHIMCTETSSLWNMLLFSLLGKAKGGFDTEVYGDFARLLATCSNVESADVPSAMQDLAYSISQNISPSEFKAMNEEEALKWLQSSTSVAGIKFRNFILRHGHRCLKEFDVRSIPWGTDTKPLIKLLQGLSGSCNEVKNKTDDDFNKIVSELQVHLDFKSRCLLRFLLPNCRRAVREREASKSILIRGMDAWRKAYHQLAKLMVCEGYIPDVDLVYFFTLEEINELLNARSPQLIIKAKRRRRIFPEMDKCIFPEIMKGIPQPLNTEDEIVDFQADLVMKGIPVSRGIAKGFARVAITLEDAALLKPGEILVTYSTDIGWSPYFPILSGVVTELGGLISHGAVVSREYGLPCVVGLHGATRQFFTGDYVLLDGNKGILQRLPTPGST